MEDRVATVADGPSGPANCAADGAVSRQQYGPVTREDMRQDVQGGLTIQAYVCYYVRGIMHATVRSRE